MEEQGEMPGGAAPQRDSSADHKDNGDFAEGNSHAWKKGQSGNPEGGRKHKTYLTRRAREFAEQKANVIPEYAEMAVRYNLDPDECTVADLLVRRAATDALRGEYQFWREIRELTDGKVVQGIVIEGASKLYEQFDGVDDA
jgi:hypothetical protein